MCISQSVNNGRTHSTILHAVIGMTAETVGHTNDGDICNQARYGVSCMQEAVIGVLTQIGLYWKNVDVHRAGQRPPADVPDVRFLSKLFGFCCSCVNIEQQQASTAGTSNLSDEEGL